MDDLIERLKATEGHTPGPSRGAWGRRQRAETVALPIDAEGRFVITEQEAVENPSLAAMIHRQSNYWQHDPLARVWRGAIPTGDPDA